MSSKELKELIGVSQHISDINKKVSGAAKSDSTVLIQGPTGTGKEIIANNIHYKSKRKNKPFEIINCGAIPHEIFESELFGHNKGAFTGAVADKDGMVKVANKGTLFFDEIGDLASDHQVKILRFLDDGSYCPVGDIKVAKTEVRVIAATNKNLREQIKNEKFREDLYYRLNGYPIYTKPLFERPEDVIILVNHFNSKADDRVKFLLYSYDLPGNVRELQNILGLTYDEAIEELERNLAQQQNMNHDTPKEPDDLSSPNFILRVKSAMPETPDKNEFYRGRLEEALKFSAKKNVDFGKIVKAYEIILLYQEAKLSQDKIAKSLHIRKNNLSPKNFKEEYGFEAPSKDCKYHLRSPIDLYNKPFSLDEFTKRFAEKYGYSKEELDKLYK